MRKNVILLLFLTAVPYILCALFSLFSDEVSIGRGGNNVEQHLLNREILIEINGLYKDMDVEEFLLGVLPGTISAEYDLETLKVQAILIRTNLLKEMDEKGTTDAADLSYRYLTVDERVETWGERNYERYQDKFEQAVVDTAGMVIRKEGNLIMALYHEVSIGKTADAKEVLGEEISYLKSVESSRDVEAKQYMNVVEFTWEELLELEGEMRKDTDVVESVVEPKEKKEVQDQKGGGEKNQEKPIDKGTDVKENQEKEASEKVAIEVTEHTENGFVRQVSVNGTIYTGEEIIERYGLKSNNFYVEEMDAGIRFVCLGKGNCLGLSQYGANCMALEGNDALDIICYYYNEVTIEPYRKGS